MAKLTKNEEYIVEQYVRYFGKTPTVDEISKYSEFKTKSAITKEIRLDSDVENNSLTNLEYVENAIQNLFGRPATTNDKKYAVKKDNDPNYVLPIATILKKGSSVDKAVYNTKKLVAQMFAEEKSTVTYNLDNITRENYSSIYNTKTKKLLITTSTELETKLVEVPDNITGKTFMLTTGADTGKEFTGTAKNDLFKVGETLISSNLGDHDGSAVTPDTWMNQYTSHLNSLDELDGGAGKDTLNITSDDDTAAYTMKAASIKNIETITIKGAHDVIADVSGSNITGLGTISVLKSDDAEVHANSTTDVNVSGATGTIDVSGGKNIVVNDATKNQAIDIGSSSTVTGVTTTTNATGTITVTDTDNSGANAITVNGGTDVTVTATATAITTGAIAIGGAKAATGDVKVTQNNNFDGTTADMANTDAITVTGGKTVEITVNNTITAKDKNANNDIDNLGQTITVNSDGKTTDVTVKQNSTVNEFVTPETALVNGKTAITFKAMTAGQALSIDGLSFHATKNLTAAEVAAAFANLTASDTQSATGTTANGYYTGKLLTTDLTTGAANGAVVEFISVNHTPVTFTVGAAQTAPAIGLIYGYNTGTIGTIVTTMQPTAGTQTTGTAYATESDTGNVVKNGAVVIKDDATTASIKTITVDGYGVASTIGTGGKVNALTDLTLKNGSATMTVTTAVASLNLTVDDVQDDVTLTAGNLKTLNLTTTGEEESVFGLISANTETLTIAAGADLDIATGSTLSALKTVTITGAGNVDLGNLSTLTDFATLNASAAKGDITAKIDGDLVTVTTGSGDDKITVNTAATTTVTKAISLGDGNDRLDLSTLDTVDATTAAISGGAGSDTVVLAAANAAVANLSSSTNSVIFKSKVTGFEKLEIGIAGAAVTVNVGNLGYNHVITNANTSLLTLADMANNGTVELNGASTGGTDVLVKDAATGKADVLNVIANVSGDVNNGTLTVADVETIKITATDSTPVNTTTGAATIDTSTLDLNATSAKTVTITGNAHLDLDMTGNTAATLIDASKMTGNLTVTAFNAGMTVKGGDGNDTLSVDNTTTASLMSNVVLTGGKGTDTFDVSAFNANGNPGSAVTITDLTAGETIVFKGTGVEKFVSGKVTLIAESTFTEYVSKAAEIANAASTGTEDNIAWFQFNNNTFVVQDVDSNGTFSATDIIVKINGVKDLSTASFNATDGTLEIA